MNYYREKNYYSTLLDCFKDDQELLEKFHIEAPNTLEKCTLRTTSDLIKAINYKFYIVKKNDELVGYFGSEILGGDQFLTGFFLKPKFRNKEDTKEYWNLIKGYFNCDFKVGIYKKNTRAIKFLEKNNAKLTQEFQIDENTTGLMYKVSLGE